MTSFVLFEIGRGISRANFRSLPMISSLMSLEWTITGLFDRVYSEIKAGGAAEWPTWNFPNIFCCGGKILIHGFARI
jgi:hypothetical protein